MDLVEEAHNIIRKYDMDAEAYERTDDMGNTVLRVQGYRSKLIRGNSSGQLMSGIGNSMDIDNVSYMTSSKDKKFAFEIVHGPRDKNKYILQELESKLLQLNRLISTRDFTLFTHPIVKQELSQTVYKCSCCREKYEFQTCDKDGDLQKSEAWIAAQYFWKNPCSPKDL